MDSNRTRYQFGFSTSAYMQLYNAQGRYMARVEAASQITRHKYCFFGVWLAL